MNTQDWKTLAYVAGASGVLLSVWAIFAWMYPERIDIPPLGGSTIRYPYRNSSIPSFIVGIFSFALFAIFYWRGSLKSETTATRPIPAAPREVPPTPESTSQAISFSGFLIASGILTIITSCLSGFLGVIGFLLTIAVLSGGAFAVSPSSSIWGLFGILLGIFGVLGFGIGLAGGILTLKRSQFSIAIVGICLNMVSSVLSTVLSIEFFLFLGIPILIMSIVGVVFASIRKNDFKS